MLTLGFQPQEFLVIGDPASEDVTVVHVQQVKGNKVKLSIQADSSIPINRGKIAMEILAGNGQQPSETLATYLKKVQEYKERNHGAV